MNLLILKGFNNYFNRIIKRYNTLADYISHSEAHYDFSGINFNPNDGVTTTHIIGSTTQQQAGGPNLVPLAWEHDGNPDYLIAYETEQVGIATNTVIRSRWFITESVRTRNGQYSLKLKRDSIADFLESLLSAPAFIKKGTVSDDNPLIVNSEGITVNQIKSGETLLKDQTGSAWLVGYMPKNGGLDGQVTLTIPTKTIEYETIENIASELGIDASDLSNVLTDETDNPSYFVNDNIEIVGWINKVDATSLEYKIVSGSSNGLSSFSYKNSQVLSHSATSDCFAKESTTQQYTALFTDKIAEYWLSALNANKTAIKNAWETITTHPLFLKNVYEKLKSLSVNGTIIYKSGKYYQVKIGSVLGPNNTGSRYYSSAVSAPFNSVCSATISAYNAWAAGQASTRSLEALSGGKIFINYNELVAYIYLEEVSASTDVEGISFSMSTTRNACMDQVYDMFAIPFSNISIEDGANTYTGIGEYAQELAVAIAEKMSDGEYSLYDLQLLPYCPIPEIAGNGNIDVTGLTSAYDYDYITQTNATLVYTSAEFIGSLVFEGTYSVDVTLTKPAGTGTLTTADITVLWSNNNHSDEHLDILSQTGISITLSLVYDGAAYPKPKIHFSWEYTSLSPIIKSVVIYPKKATFSVNINQTLALKDSMKVEALCNNYRLVSPNYQGSFDFNVAKNGGTVNGFIADCTYKPYTPYIKVAPNFSWLYGSNYGDCRGLICSGDFSLGRVNSAWESYEMQNKNYQNIFNREIQNLDVNQSIQRTQQYVSGGLNIVRDTIAGGVGGGLATGSPYGAIAGAAVGAIGSGIGYGMDMNLMEKSLQEQRQFSIDKYKMQLGNIQALPYTLTKVGAFNINSKVWPFLEYYTCSEQEKEALRMKIQYEGMTVGIVDYLGNYMNGGYVQADLIRNESIIEDSHLLDDIYIELTKGVYM